MTGFAVPLIAEPRRLDARRTALAVAAAGAIATVLGVAFDNVSIIIVGAL
jgi:hypothetical protein